MIKEPEYREGDLVERTSDGAIFACYGSWLAEVELPMARVLPHLLVRKLNENRTWSHKFELLELEEGFLRIIGKWK